MKTIQGLLLSLALILTVASCSKSSTDSSSDGSGKSSSGKKLKIAVIPKGTSHVFWKSIHAGAMKAAKEFNVEVIWQGPQKEDDRDQQISVVETFISKQVDAIVLAPLDEKALAGPVKAAKNSQIPTVIIDSGLKSTDHVSFVATNNFNGGVLAAKRLAEVLDGKGKVLMLRYMVGSASTKNREEGFMKKIAKHEGISVVSSNK